MVTFLIICLAVLGLINLVLLFKFFGRKTEATRAPVVSTKEKAAVALATTAIIEKAKTSIKAEGKKAELEKVMKIEDPSEQLSRLAELLKDL